MGSSVVPVPSSSGGGGRSWVQLASVTPTAVSSISFSGLTAYKYYRVVAWNISITASSVIYMRLNNDSGNNYSCSYLIQGTSPVAIQSATTFIILGPNDNNPHSLDAYISYADQYAKIDFDIISLVASGKSGYGIWSGNTQVNRIDLNTGVTFQANGNITVYGSN